MPASGSNTSIGARFSPANAAWVLSCLYLLAVLLFVVEVSWQALAMHYDVPHRDDWRIFDNLFSKGAFEWIFTDQNGHWMPVTLTLLLVDYTVFSGQMHLLAAASVLCLAVALGILAVALAPRGSGRQPLGLAALGSAGFALAWGVSRHDLAWGVNQGTVMAAMWTLVSLSTLGVWLERRHTQTPGPRLLVLAALAATAATFSQGIGFSCWGGLLVVAVAARVRFRVLASLGACALGTLLLYRSGLRPPVQLSMQFYGDFASSDPVALVGRVLAFVGSPVRDVLSSARLVGPDDRYEVARLCGGVGAVVFVATALRTALRSPRLTPREVLAIGLPATALTGGLMVALNRTFLPETIVDIRFATWSALFWVGLVAAVPARVPSWMGAWGSVAGALSLALASWLALPALEVARATQGEHRDRLAVLRMLHLLDIRWEFAARGTKLAPSPEGSYRVVERFRRDGKSFFAAPDARWPGSLLGDPVALADERRCSGGVTQTRGIPARGGRALIVSGWGVDHRHDRPIGQVVITNDSDVIVGMGVAVDRSSRIVLAKLPARDFPWTGYIRSPFSAGPYRAFGLLDEGRTACLLGPVEPRAQRSRGPRAAGEATPTAPAPLRQTSSSNAAMGPDPISLNGRGHSCPNSCASA